MAKLEKKSFDAPDGTRPMEKARMDFVQLGGATLVRRTFEPGWRWSKHMKPGAGTKSCRATHLFCVVSGRMGVRMDSGMELEYGSGDVVLIPPGHDGWVVGRGPAVLIEVRKG